jgi:uncharacterized protein (DUF4415 family)
MSAKKSNSVSARKGLTDWGRIDALTDADIAEAVAADADAAPVDVDWSVADIVVPPAKQAISIRLDADVLEYLRGEGPGYQRRINAILRTYVESKRRRA